jgi:hypothetical protein
MQIKLMIHERNNERTIVHDAGAKCALCDSRAPVIRVTIDNGIIHKHFGYEHGQSTTNSTDSNR